MGLFAMNCVWWWWWRLIKRWMNDEECDVNCLLLKFNWFGLLFFSKNPTLSIYLNIIVIFLVISSFTLSAPLLKASSEFIIIFLRPNPNSFFFPSNWSLFPIFSPHTRPQSPHLNRLPHQFWIASWLSIFFLSHHVVALLFFWSALMKATSKKGA